MPKESKIKTPAWITEGYDSPADYEKANGGKTKKDKSSSVKLEKMFKVKICPKCSSEDVNVVLSGEEGRDAKEWECKKCLWKGKDIEEKEMTEEKFMEYLDERGEEVA